MCVSDDASALKNATSFRVQKGKKVRLSQPTQFMAQDREIVDEAYPGDIIGIHDPGIYNIGDSLCEDNSKIIYDYSSKILIIL